MNSQQFDPNCNICTWARSLTDEQLFSAYACMMIEVFKRAGVDHDALHKSIEQSMDPGMCEAVAKLHKLAGAKTE